MNLLNAIFHKGLRTTLTLLTILFYATAHAQLENCEEILDIRITNVNASNFVTVDDTRAAGLLSFDGDCDNQYFKGVILPGGFDNMKKEDGKTTLSARYMLKGLDCAGDTCLIFIENNALGDSDYSQPKVFTDSKALSFLNHSKLIGFLDHRLNHQFHVRIYKVNE